MTIRSLYPDSEPSIALDFVNRESLDGRINFTRASTGTYIGSDGLIKTAGRNVPRFDRDPLTGDSLGLLLEEARTNLEPQSTSLSTWTATNSSLVGQTITAPDGTLSTVQLLREDASTGTHYASRFYNNTYTAWCISFYVKAAGRTRFRISVIDNTTTTRFDLSAKTVNGVINSGLLEELPNGWFRVKSVYGGAYRVGTPPITLEDNSGNSSYTGDNTSGIYIWGVQLEQATGVTFSSSYIPTSGSTITRAADLASILNNNIYSKDNFTIISQPFGSATGSNSLNLIGPTIKQALVYPENLPQVQINGVARNNDGFWRWRVLGSSFALPSFTTNGTVTVDWGDGVIETLNNSAHTFTNGGGYHDIGFRLNSGTFFKPAINNNATYKTRVIAVGPAPASMKLDASFGFLGCSALKAFDGTVDTGGRTSFYTAWRYCSSLTSFPLINTAAGTDFTAAWDGCSSLTSFPSINTAAGTNFYFAWSGCSGLTSFPLIDITAGTNFGGAWQNCTGLTAFPLINTAAGTFFGSAWANCSSLTSFPLIDTTAGTNFGSAWSGCSSLTSFPLINTAAGTTFGNAWRNCSGLTSFPLINTAAGTSFYETWRGCTSLTSFPLINTSAGTNFFAAWLGCTSLTSFPLINTSAGTNFSYAWTDCTSLATFPANMFDTTGTLVATAFSAAFQNCALTATSIENILTSLVTNGQSNITLTLGGGTNANASTWSAAANTAYATLISRGWTITQNGASPYGASVSLLLHGDGTNGSTTITDNSLSPKTVTAVGNAQISTAQSKFGGASIAFDGTGDNLTVPDSGSFTMGTADFTVECWVRLANTSHVGVFITTGQPSDFQGFFLGHVNGNLYFLADGTGSVPWDVSLTAGSIGANSWTHVAGVRFGNTFTSYVNGTQAATTTSSISLANSNNILHIGGRAASGQYLNGYIDDLRITKGIALYTANFTPPTAAFPNP